MINKPILIMLINVNFLFNNYYFKNKNFYYLFVN